MKNKLKYFFIIITVLAIQTPVLALDDWSGVYDAYNEAEYGKIISNDEYKDAVKTVTRYKQGKRVDKKNKSKEKITEKKPTEKKVLLDGPGSSEPLFVLPIDVNYEGKTIRQGFYLVQPISRNNKHFIRLTQGEGNLVADIKANVFKTDNFQKNSGPTKKIFSEKIKEDMLKITYSNRRLILEAYLWIQ